MAMYHLFWGLQKKYYDYFALALWLSPHTKKWKLMLNIKIVICFVMYMMIDHFCPRFLIQRTNGQP